MTGWIASRIWRKSFLRTWGGGALSLKTEHKIWGILWLVGVYCESDMWNVSDKRGSQDKIGNFYV